MFCIAVLLTVLGLANCALIPHTPFTDGRIVGGEDVTIEEYPYQVSVQRDGAHLCGGTILSVNVILTAAHCTYWMSASSLSARAGSNHLGRGGQVLNVKRIIQHDLYNPDFMDYDISILQLQSSLTLGSGVQPASLAVHLPLAGTTVVVSGWGTLTAGGLVPFVLQAVEVKIVTQITCKDAYGSFAVTECLFCTYAELKDACQGDSGGPLVLNGTRTLVGVISLGRGCARPIYPGIYASVPNLRSWIESNM